MKADLGSHIESEYLTENRSRQWPGLYRIIVLHENNNLCWTDSEQIMVLDASPLICPLADENIDRYLADGLSHYRTTIDRLSTNYRPTIDRLSTDCRPTIDRLSTEYRPTVDRLSTDCRPLCRPLCRPISQSTLPTVNKIRWDYEMQLKKFLFSSDEYSLF